MWKCLDANPIAKLSVKVWDKMTQVIWYVDSWCVYTVSNVVTTDNEQGLLSYVERQDYLKSIWDKICMIQKPKNL